MIVDDAVNDDNSVIALNLTPWTYWNYSEDTVLVKGKKRKDTVLIALIDDELKDGVCRVNRIVETI